MRILFLHGRHSAPGGVKPTHLAQNGHDVINPKLPDDDFEEAVHIAQAEFDRHKSDTDTLASMPDITIRSFSVADHFRFPFALIFGPPLG